MKKILIILLIFYGAFANAQYQGYTNINQRYNWLAGLFNSLGVPAGGNAAFQTGQNPRAGSVYYDSTGIDSGLYVWSGLAWRQVGSSNDEILRDELISGGEVTYTGDGLKFFIAQAVVRLGGIIYNTDSLTVTLDAGGIAPRKDVFYLDSTGAHVLKGIESADPLKPQVEGGQWDLTFADIGALATTPGITTFVIWDENAFVSINIFSDFD